MDNYEVNFPEEGSEPIAQNPTEAATTPCDDCEQPVSGKQASPFADSPYVSQHIGYEPVHTAPARQPKKPGRIWKRALCCVLIVALVAAGCGITAIGVNSYWSSINAQTAEQLDSLSQQLEALKEQIKDNSFTGNGNSVSGSANINAQGLTPGQVYAKCVNSVVAITASNAQGSVGSTGSGFVLTQDGYIVSNYHVVSGMAALSVTTHSGEKYEAQLIGYDDRNDLALLKADATGLTPATLGSSSKLIVGDQVVAIGNPLGELSATLTVGYVSGKDRAITTDGTMINMIQTDAAINPGNSGGPLFNMKGEVIGITTAKYSGTTSSGASIEGIGFAIPIDDVSGKLLEIKENGYVSTPYMGVEVTNQYDGMGVYVNKVEADGAAAAAGMKPGDLIVSIGDSKVSTMAMLTGVLKQFKVGDTTTVAVLREGKLLELTLTFGEMPRQADATPEPTLPEPEQQTDSSQDFEGFWDWFEHFFGNGNG